MKFFLCVLFTLPGISSFCQYYYTDIIAQNQSKMQYQILIGNKIKRVLGFAFDPFGNQTKDFQTEQSISPDGNRIITISLQPNQPIHRLINDYQNGLLQKSLSISSNDQSSTETETTFSYNALGLIETIETNTIDTFVTFNANKEIHLWSYDNLQKPEKMKRIVNNKDTVQVTFEKDEKGFIGVEKWSRKGKVFNSIFYYYDENGNLSDIVKYRNDTKTFQPELVFEYDKEGRVVKTIQSIKGNTSHLTWKYTYNKAGLKEQELCYDSKYRPQGKVEYDYKK